MVTNSTVTTVAAAAGISPYVWFEVIMVILFTSVAVVLVLMLARGKPRVLILERVRPHIWRQVQGRYDEKDRKLKWPKGNELEIPRKEDLDVVKPGSKWRYVAFKIKDTFVNITDPVGESKPGETAKDLSTDPLIDPEDLPKDEERKSLVQLLSLKIPKSDLLFYLLIGIGMGAFLGLFVGQIYHPGLVQGPPAGYQYAVQKINETATSITSSTSSLPFPHNP
jgi:hypothetical protein